MTHQTACPVCGAPASLESRAKGHIVSRCTQCAHWFWQREQTSTVIENERANYETYVYDAIKLEDIPQVVFTVLEGLTATFERYRSTGRLLDVGFGVGALLSVAKKRGWQTHGIEASRVAVEDARARDLGSVVQGDVLAPPWRDGFFDVVVMTELVEHIADARPFLAVAHRLLRPGGLLYLTTPNGRGLSARVLGAGWSVVCPPEHVHLFSEDSIARALTSVGFGPVRVRSQGVFVHELAGAARALLGGPSRASAPDAAANVPNGDARTGAAYALNSRLMGSHAGRFVKRAINAGAGRLRLGDNLVVFAERT